MSQILDYEWTKETASNLKAAWNGGADAHMQRRVIQHLVEVICGVNQIALVPGNPDMTAFNSGRAWVARQIQNAITIPLDKLVKEEVHEPRSIERAVTATERAAAVAVGQHAAISTGPKRNAARGRQRATGGSYTGP